MIDNENNISNENKEIHYNVNKVNYNNDYMQGIDPYIESLNFFTKIPEISKEFKSKYKENNRNPNLPSEFNSIDEFIQYFLENNILKNEGGADFEEKEKENEKNKFEENPQKMFDFLLQEIHKIFKINSNEEDNNQRERAPEYDQNKAQIAFNEFVQKDYSIISDLFFGAKLIQKYCNNCQLEQYIYKYLKFIKIDLKDIKENGRINLEDLLEKALIKFEDNKFCSMCSNKQSSTLKITITKYPKILIIIITNPYMGIRINFPKYLYNKKYELIAVEANIIKDITGIFQDILECFKENIFKIFGKKQGNKKYDLFFNKKEKENSENNFNVAFNCGKPYVLFYKKREEKSDRKKTSEDDLSANHMISDDNDKKTDIGNNLNNINNINNISNSFENNNNIEMNIIKKKKKNSINGINNTNNINNITNISNNNNFDDSSNNKEIILYFYFENNNKELYIDVYDNDKFENIIKNLIEHYKLGDNFIYEYNFSFNKKKIDFQKTPKQLGIKSESKIKVNPN